MNSVLYCKEGYTNVTCVFTKAFSVPLYKKSEGELNTVEMSALYTDFSGPGALNRGEHKSCNHNNLAFFVQGEID